MKHQMMPEDIRPRSPRRVALTYADLDPSQKDALKAMYRGCLIKAGVPARYIDKANASSLRSNGIDREKRVDYQEILDFSLHGGLEEDGNFKSSLYLYGDYGTGKTHAATVVFKQAVWACVQEYFLRQQEENLEGRQLPPFREKFFWRPMPEMLVEIQASQRPGADIPYDRLLSMYKSAKVLMIDDAGNQQRMEETAHKRELFHEIINSRYNSVLPTYLTSNFSLGKFQELYGRQVTDRLLEICVVLPLRGESWRSDKMAA